MAWSLLYRNMRAWQSCTATLQRVRFLALQLFTGLIAWLLWSKRDLLCWLSFRLPTHSSRTGACCGRSKLTCLCIVSVCRGVQNMVCKVTSILWILRTPVFLPALAAISDFESVSLEEDEEDVMLNLIWFWAPECVMPIVPSDSEVVVLSDDSADCAIMGA